MKCNFCSFTVPQEMVSTYTSCGSSQRESITVVESGWRELQLHCQKEHHAEPAVRELLFSDAPLLNYLENVVKQKSDRIKMDGFGDELFIETEEMY